MKFLKFLKWLFSLAFLAGLAWTCFFVWSEWICPDPQEVAEEEKILMQMKHEELLDMNLSESKKYPFVVVINPAHGGGDSGEKSDTLLEKDVVLAISQKVKELNVQEDIGIFLTRESDVNSDENMRREFLEKMKPDLYIDVHVGKKPQNNEAGTTVYYVTDYYNYQITNVGLADMMERNVVSSIEGVATGIFEDTENQYPLLKGVGCPSVAIEAGCLSGPVEGVLLGRESYQENIAAGILKTIEEVYKKVN